MRLSANKAERLPRLAHSSKTGAAQRHRQRARQVEKEFEMTVIKFPLQPKTAARTRVSKGPGKPGRVSPKLAAMAGKKDRGRTTLSGTMVDPVSQAHPRALLFGHYPLRMARELIGFSVPRMAAEFGYAKTEWMRIEANIMPLPVELVHPIEQFVRCKLAQMCR